MRSNFVSPNTIAYPSDYNTLIEDSAGAGRLLAHQMLGYFTLSTNPGNTKTLTLDINGTNVVVTFVSSIGSTAGNVLIGASAAATCANLINLLLNPTLTSATQVAIGVNTAANTTLVNYLGYALTGTTLVISSMNTLVNAPLTSFSGSTTATSDSYTASTLTLFVEPGVVYINGTEVYFTGGATPAVTAPSSHPRIDVLTIDNTGTLAWTTGSENVSPVAPTYPANKLPICELYNVTSETVLNDNGNQTSGAGYVLNDVRPFLAYPIPIGAVPDSILPSADATYNLGSASFRWASGYFSSNVFVNGLAMSGHFGGTGADGAVTVTSGTTTISAGSAAYLIKNYTSISITGTAYVQFTSPHANGTIIQVKSQGNITLTSSATPMLDASGMGATGGTANAAAAAKQPNASTYLPTGMIGVGGTVGSPPSPADAAGGTTPGATIVVAAILGKFILLACGAGGGGGGGGSSGCGAGGAGGNGGGALYVECGGSFNFTTSSGISVAGAAGSAGAQSGGQGGGGGGGGGGGMFTLLYAALTANSGTVTVSGGSGGAGGAGAGSPNGAGGGGGASIINSGSAGAGAAAAGGAGGNGTSIVEANQDFS
jgi:hypothetical protein